MWSRGLKRAASRVHPRGLSATHRMPARFASSMTNSQSLEKIGPGDTLFGFICEKVTQSKVLGTKLYSFRHELSGARYLHADRDDSQNTFCVFFRTPVSDHTGVPHILEHTTLCGSQRYPVKDPFFLLSSRSLKTFMNAFTANEWTAYPFSTQNEQDYRNLLSIYTDSVFFPLLREQSFRQEGHRWEFNDPQDPQSGLVLRGVVYNEMQGDNSDVGSRYMSAVGEHLYADDCTYKYNSGGDPMHIPDLSYQELLDFHKRYYAPHNACFVTYGTQPPHQTMAFLQESVFARMDPKELKEKKDVKYVHYRPQWGWDAPRTVQVDGPPAPMSVDNRVHISSASWLLRGGIPYEVLQYEHQRLADQGSDASHLPPLPSDPEASEYERYLNDISLRMAATVAMDGPHTALYQDLLGVGLGNAFSPGSGFSDAHPERAFSVGVQGCSPEQVPDVHQAIDSALTRFVEHGVSDAGLCGPLHLSELGLKTAHTQFGLGLTIEFGKRWASFKPAEEVLYANEGLAELRYRLGDEACAGVKYPAPASLPAIADTLNSQHLQDIVRDNLLDNPHRLNLTMLLGETVLEKEAAAVQARVDEAESKLDSQQEARLMSLAEDLRQFQQLQEKTAPARVPVPSLITGEGADTVNNPTVLEDGTVLLPSMSASDIPPTVDPVLVQPLSAVDQKWPTDDLGDVVDCDFAFGDREGMQVAQHVCPVNGIVTFRSYAPLTGFLSSLKTAGIPPVHSLPLLKILQSVATEIAVKSNPTVSGFALQCQRTCGSLSSSVAVHQGFGDTADRWAVNHAMVGSALDRNVTSMLDLVREVQRGDVVLTDQKDPEDPDDISPAEQLSTLLLQMYQGYTGALQHSGHRVALKLVKSFMSPEDQVRERLSGVTFGHWIAELMAACQNGDPSDDNDMLARTGATLESLAQGLTNRNRGVSKAMIHWDENSRAQHTDTVKQHLVSLGNMEDSVSDDGVATAAAVDAVSEWLSAFKPSPLPWEYLWDSGVNDSICHGFNAHNNKNVESKAPTTTQEPVRVFLKVPISVNHVAAAVKVFNVGKHSQSELPCNPTVRERMALCLLADIVSHNELHTRIREEGGAYGSGCSVGETGQLVFFSFRDPESMETLQRFESSWEWGLRGEFSDQQMEDALISIIAAVDAPVNPDRKGLGIFHSGMSNKDRLERRQALLSLTREDLQGAVKKFFPQFDPEVPGSSALAEGKFSVAVVGDAQSVPDAVEKSDSGWIVHSLNVE